MLTPTQDPITKTRILTPSSATEFSALNHPASIRNSTRNIPTAHPLFLPYDLQAVDPEGSFGLGSAIQGEDRVLPDGKTGRSKGSVYWVGAANVSFWIDGVKGVVVVAAGNFFPFMDGEWVRWVEGLEGAVYGGLEG